MLKILISSDVYTVNYGFAAIFHLRTEISFVVWKSGVMFCSLSAHSPHSKCGGTKVEDHNATSVPLLSCNKDISCYLRSLGVSGTRGRAYVDVTELDLILNRAGLLVINDEDIKKMTICPRHRKYLTVNWPGGKAVSCRYPLHQKRQSRTICSGKVRRMTKQVSEEIYWMYDTVVPIGEGKYESHQMANNIK